MKDTGGKDITKKQGQVKPDDGSKGKEKTVDIKACLLYTSRCV